jgi:hypothetical protein
VLLGTAFWVLRASSLQVLVNDIYEFFGSSDPGIVAPCTLIDHVLANVILDHFCNEAIQRTAAGSGLLQNIGAFLARHNGALDRLDLPTQSLDAIEQFRLFLFNVPHTSLVLS